MRVAILISILLVLAAAAFVLFRHFSGTKQPAPQISKATTLEEKLTALNKCGLDLADAFTVDELLKSFDREEYEKDGYESVLVGLGMTEEQEPWRDRSATVWHFDTEAIEDNGDYKRIADRMVELSQGSLSLQNIQDHVDIENGQAWLSFTPDIEFSAKRFPFSAIEVPGMCCLCISAFT